MNDRKPWYQSGPGILLATLLLPPVGLVLLWLRPSRRVTSIIGKLALSGFIVILTLVYAVRLGIVYMEQSGAGWKPIFSFRDPRKDQEALESHRAAQQVSLAPSLPAPVVETTPAPLKPNDEPAPIAVSWPDFRGRDRDGIYTEVPLITSWPQDGLKPLWRQPSGGGYASYVIAGGKAFTIEQRRGNEVAVAYDLRTGRELWTNSWPALFSEFLGGDGPRATPTWHEGRVYALGAEGELRCLDAAKGSVIWSVNILADNAAGNLTWGMSAAPLIVDGKVIVLPGGGNGKSVVAYDKNTGKRVWSVLDDQQAYTSPVILTIAGRRQLVVVSAERVMGLTIEDGSLLWQFPWTTMQGINSAQPILVDDSHVFVSAGYDHGSVLLAISQQDGKFNAQPAWQNNMMKNRFNSSLLYAGNIYGFDESIFASIAARTGERRWKAGRYGYGQALLVPGTDDASARVILLAESGELVLIHPSPNGLEELARFQAIEGKTWNVPAIGEGILLVRNAREMAAFDLRKR